MLNYDPEGPAYTVSIIIISHLIWSAEEDLVWDLRPIVIVHNKLMWEERTDQL